MTCRDVLFQTVEIETLDRDLEKNQEILICRVIETVETLVFELSRKSRLSRCPFSNYRDNLNCRGVLSQTVDIETLDRVTIETNQDPYS